MIDATANELLRRDRARSRRVVAHLIRAQLSGLETFAEQFREAGLDPQKVVLALKELLMEVEP
jgi:hypothetical protein